MEIWKPVKGFEKSNEVSNLGNLRSKDRFINKKNGQSFFRKGVNKKFRKHRDGYNRCNIKVNGKSYDVMQHRLVADAFIPNPNNYKQVNHKNGIKDDNRVENLEWCDQSQNIQHAVKNRLIKTKLTDKQAIEIYNSELSQRKLAKIYEVNHSIVWRIKNKKAYKHLWNNERSNYNHTDGNCKKDTTKRQRGRGQICFFNSRPAKICTRTCIGYCFA
jgi:hypothetical protein